MLQALEVAALAAAAAGARLAHRLSAGPERWRRVSPEGSQGKESWRALPEGSERMRLVTVQVP